MNIAATNQLEFNTSVQRIDGSKIALPVTKASPLFLVGPNGAGKSGLISAIYRANLEKAVRIAAHRQNWMASNNVPFSPADKVQTEQNVRSQDALSDARWSEWNPGARAGIVLANLIDADNAMSRQIREALVARDRDEAERLAATPAPLEIISRLFQDAGIPITLSIGENSSVVASKNGGPQYSVASLSDGERAALLIAGAVLTAKKGALILVDEPERHLHSSIVTPLLLQLFGQRPDCAFVVSTHELNLPVSCSGARTVIVRHSEVVGEDVARWELDILDPSANIDDETMKAVLGSRRKILFVEGRQSSLDKPLYELLFPGVSIFPRASCRDVQYAVASLRDSSGIAWVEAYGIVDRDQLTLEKVNELVGQGVFPLSTYSVEALYYDPVVLAKLAERQSSVIGSDPSQIIDEARQGLLQAVCFQKDRLAARMSEQAVKDQISLQSPDWKEIKSGCEVSIKVDTDSVYKAEVERLTQLLSVGEVEKIIKRYPIRETGALEAVVSSLGFRNRSLYESAVRKLVSEDTEIRSMMLGFFEDLPSAIGTG